MFKGSINKITLSSSSFEKIISDGAFFVDKTKMIERFLNEQSEVQLIARQRRMGKSLNMDMLRCFLTNKEDLRHLFKDLYIESSQVWESANSSPVFYFDFKGLRLDTYKKKIYDKVCDYIDSYCSNVDLPRAIKRYLTNDSFNDTDGLRHLTEAVFRATGKRSYILIDEYDKLLMDYHSSELYEEIRDFETAFLSEGLKGNVYLEKALLTGVMRISHESMFSGLNNIVTYDVFNDKLYTDDYGLTDEEVTELSKLSDFDINELRDWYNGIRIGGSAVYNIYSTMSYLTHGEYECFWGKTGTLDTIIDLMNDEQKLAIAELLNGNCVEVNIDSRVSLRQLSRETGNKAFYSLLVQGGYLAIVENRQNKGKAVVSIPNKELQIVWRDFILDHLYNTSKRVQTLFDNFNNLTAFSKDIEYFLGERLSYYDLSVYGDDEKAKTYERVYHIFLLGILSAYEDIRFSYALSNRESGDGRYDIFVEKSEAYFIFEVKSCVEGDDLNIAAGKALAQIETMRYGAELKKNKPLIKIGVAVYGKRCKVKCGKK